MGIENLMELFSFENITIPSTTYAIFTTKIMKKPVSDYKDLRMKIVSEWLPGSGYRFANSPEINFIHWQPIDENRNRYIEIWMPVEKS